jgi:hypothetical protein
MNKIDEVKFKEMTGREPENDDLDRCNCPKAGTKGHSACGICKHNLPVFECNDCFHEMTQSVYSRLK